MAFEPAQLSSMAYANGFTLWQYRAPSGDGQNQLEGNDPPEFPTPTPGYFDAAARDMKIGDVIAVRYGISGSSAWFQVIANDGAAVTVEHMHTPPASPN